jgi:hypothetical protein
MDYGIASDILNLSCTELGLLKFQALRTRSDIAIAVAAPDSYDEPHVDNQEFSSFAWLNMSPKRLGSNYRRMLEKWRLMGDNKESPSQVLLNSFP